MTLRQSHVVHLQLQRTAEDVYAFLVKPQHYAEWAAVTGPMVHVGGSDWRVETAFGERLVRFCAPNTLGILDHAVFREGERPVMLPMWVVPNGAGCDLIFVFFRRPEMSEQQFASALEWINTDFLTLKSLLET